MRRFGLAVGVLALTLVGAGSVTAAPTSPFEGSWTSIDPVDGSTQHLYVRGGTGVQVRYVDEYGTTCAEIGASSTVFTGILAGRVSGNELDATFQNAGCGTTLVLTARIGFSWIFEYDPDTDTLWGAINDGPATWHRE
jgi:hypothetical protein